ncbi:hypothetical protein CBR_g46380 [Chara braunii]|uniref:Reverse transcriptase n=1 Tax=Chara braunii TaxID=69332 RepID=A0A388M0K7_CHABU|nr:hypothetical protein CBR_g46380 [Chara braunii]|eukprot:GBG88009.1 hypothetical protein CBR_g46380 [Chara braunii]
MERYCTGVIEGARLTAPKEEEACPRREPVKIKFPASYGGKKEENFDNWEANIKTYLHLQKVAPDEHVLIAIHALREEAASFARSLCRAANCNDDLVAYSAFTPLNDFLKLLRERFADVSRSVKASDKLQTIHSRQWKSVRALKGVMDELVAVPDHGVTETQLVNLFYRAMPEPLLDNSLAHCCLSAPAFARLVKAEQLEEQVFVAYVRPVTEPKEEKPIDPAIAKLLEEYVDLAKPPTGVVPRPIQHRIEIEPGSRTPKGAVYRMSLRELEELCKQLDELLEKGWIRPSSSPFGAPVLFVPKKEGELRMCIDYRGLNAITVKNAEPLPRIDDLLDRVQGCKYFSKIDLKFGYHQIEVHLDDQYKTAFRTRYGHYEFIVMPFGLTNAPTTFQRCMNDLFRPWLDRFIVVYLDDILVFSRTLQEHEGHLRQVLEKLREANFKINAKKCEWAKTQVLYLGHVLDGDGIKPEDSKIAAIRDWPTPRTLTELRSFLGLANYYKKFVRNFSTIAAPLRRLLKKEIIWKWDKDCTSAMKKLKQALIEYPVLTVADPSLPFIVTTDARQYGIGVVLQQDDGNGYRPEEFMSARMPSEKVATSTYERELYAPRQALEHWKHYLLGRHFKVYSDHETLSEEIRSLILGECHDTEGHFGWQKTLANLMRAYIWYGMKVDCIEYVRNCKTKSMETHLPVVGGYGERLEFASLGLIGGIDGLASRVRTDVGFDVGKERGPVEIMGDVAEGFLETEVSDSLGVVVYNQELGTETTYGRDAKAAGSFGVDVEEMVDEGIVGDRVKVTEFGVGSGEVGTGGVAMDEAMLERLREVDMRHGSKDFLRGLVIGSAREGIGNTIGLTGTMVDCEGDMRGIREKGRGTHASDELDRRGERRRQEGGRRSKLRRLSVIRWETKGGTTTHPYTPEEEAKAATILKERRGKKEAKKKALLEEQAAKLKKIEEEMAREKERLKKEEEAKLKEVEEEEEEEEQPLERRREQRGQYSESKSDEMEKRISEWVANLSLGEEEEVAMYIPKDEQEAAMKEWDAEEDPLKRQAMEDEKKMEWRLRMMREKKRRVEAASEAAKELEQVKNLREQMAAQVDLQRKVEIIAQSVERLARVLLLGDERRLRAEARVRNLEIVREAATAVERILAAATVSAGAMATSATSTTATSFGFTLGIADTTGQSVFSTTGSRASQMAGLQSSSPPLCTREQMELQQVERIRLRLEEELEKVVDRENEIRNRSTRLESREANKAALAGLDSALNDTARILKANIMSMHAYMDSKLDVVQDTLDQILNTMHRPGVRPAALPSLPFSAMTGPYPPQSQEGPKLRPVEYMSKKMSSQKLAKSTYEKELYAIYKALAHWRHYLLGRFFIVRTDHHTLKGMRTQPVLSDALKRWIEVSEQYDFEPQYLKGEYNKVFDALSRRPDFSGALITELGLADDATRSLVEAYREDQFMCEIIRRLEAKDKGTSVEFELVNGLLFLEKARNKRSCVCERDKPSTQAPLGLLKPLPIPERPGESLSMDFMDTLVTSKSGMRYVYVIVDRFSKYARLVAMPTTAKTKSVIKLFKENWVRDFGLPKSIVSDRDVRFTSELWKAAAAEQGTQLQMISGNHQEANGQAKQLNHVVQHLLRHYIKPNQVDWDEKLALIASLYNNVVHIATGAVEQMHKAQAAMIEYENKHRRPSTFQGEAAMRRKALKCRHDEDHDEDDRGGAWKSRRRARCLEVTTTSTAAWRSQRLEVTATSTVEMTKMEAATSTPKLTPPPMYSGEDPKVDVSNWVTAMQAYLGNFVCPEVTKVGTILGRLERTALKWCTSSSAKQNLPMDKWAQQLKVEGLLQALQDRFADREQARKAADKILLLGSRRFEGSLSKLYSLFESLTATPGLEMSESDHTHFLRAAPLDYSIALYSQGHKDWRSFGKAALDLESRLKVQEPSEGRRRPSSRGQCRKKGALLAADAGSDSDASQRGSPPSETASVSAVEPGVLALAENLAAMFKGKMGNSSSKS